MWLSSWFGWLSCSAPLSAFRFPCESLWCKINAFVSELELYPRSHSNDADMLNCAAVGFCVLGLCGVINQLPFVLNNDQWACEFLCMFFCHHLIGDVGMQRHAQSQPKQQFFISMLSCQYVDIVFWIFFFLLRKNLFLKDIKHIQSETSDCQMLFKEHLSKHSPSIDFPTF